jgi:hypothetical protein
MLGSSLLELDPFEWNENWLESSELREREQQFEELKYNLWRAGNHQISIVLLGSRFSLRAGVVYCCILLVVIAKRFK